MDRNAKDSITLQAGVGGGMEEQSITIKPVLSKKQKHTYEGDREKDGQRERECTGAACTHTHTVKYLHIPIIQEHQGPQLGFFRKRKLRAHPRVKLLSSLGIAILIKLKMVLNERSTPTPTPL